MQIARELAKEICTGKPSTSLLVQKWKEGAPTMYEEIRKQENLIEDITFHDSIDTEEALKRVNRSIVLPARKIDRHTIYNIGIAASFLLILGTAAIWLWMDNRKDAVAEWATSVPISPKTSIIVQNNESVELAENNLAVKGNRLVGTTLDGKRNVAIELKNDNQFNKLSVPAGGEYQLTLEDGTVVQVNAASELLFPTHFKKHIRQVELTGEAYFKVKHNTESPFHVLLGALNVQVTGTAFNIKAYEEEGNIYVTLIEGSVNVRKDQEILATLSPGEQFTYRKTTGEYNTTQVNIPSTTGWTEDKFIFHNETIGAIMAELSRWYNVEISVSEDIREMRYNGILSRKQPLIDILNILQLTNELDFKFRRDRRIDAIEKKH